VLSSEIKLCWPEGIKAQNSRPPTDIQAALTVVDTRNRANDGRLTVVDFDHAQLAHAQLSDLHLSRADFSGTSLTHADLTGVDLTGAYLTGASFRGANLTGAKWSKNVPAPDGWGP
jgi:uncharacterized protein YjbI with pentapeptide repeats